VGGWDLTLAAVPKEGLGLLLCRVQGRTAKNSKINPHILVRRCMIFDPWLIVALHRVLYRPSCVTSIVELQAVGKAHARQGTCDVVIALASGGGEFMRASGTCSDQDMGVWN
jgi:hypothetical protein